MIGNVIQDLFTDAGDYPAAGGLVDDADVSSSRWCSSTSAGRGRRTWCDRLREGPNWFGRADHHDHRHLVLIYMFVPIFVVVAMSFNDPPSRNLYQFGSFTWDNWAHPCGAEGMCEAVMTSIQIGLLATIVATILGTLMAFALVRHRFYGRSADQPVDLPADGLARDRDGLVAAGAVRRAGLRRSARVLDDPDRPHHVLPVVRVVTVKARLSGMDSRLEQAAMDLYATEWQTFWRVTLPAGLPRHPGRRAAGVLAVASTTSSSRTSTPAPPRRSRSSCGARRNGRSRCRSTWSAP